MLLSTLGFLFFFDSVAGALDLGALPCAMRRFNSSKLNVELDWTLDLELVLDLALDLALERVFLVTVVPTADFALFRFATDRSFGGCCWDVTRMNSA